MAGGARIEDRVASMLSLDGRRSIMGTKVRLSVACGDYEIVRALLAEGELPAMINPYIPKPIVSGDRRVARLFPTYEEVELEYFRQTGIFPIMHVTVIKQEIVDKYPWAATSLVKAFDKAKQMAYRRGGKPGVVPPPLFCAAWGEG